MYSFVIFDVDGTLIDTENAVIESYQKVIFEEFGRRFTEKELTAAYGIPTPQALERLGIQNIDRACQQYYKNLFKAFAEVKPFEGILELLEEIKVRNVPSGLVTSRNRSEVANDPSLQSLLKYFSQIICAEDTQKHKPEAEPVLKLIEKTDADISKVIYLGDTYYDYMCARNAGVKFALASWGARSTENIQADYVLKEPKDLLELLF
jgi:HAD superfamily hydrolase (TIGR01549 family)